MEELSLHILDIAQNSFDANAHLVRIELTQTLDKLTIVIADDGDGMDKDQLARCKDAHYSTKGTQGMGLALFKEICEKSGGYLDVQSSKGAGTRIEGTFLKNCIPIGDIGSTIAPLLSDDSDILLQVDVQGQKYTFDTRELKSELNGISIQTPSIIVAVKKLINENIYEIGGAKL